jgi:hypothetical protein
MGSIWLNTFRKNRTQIIVLAILVLLFVTAIRGMDTRDWVITLLRGLSVGAVTFIVASGFSLIFGLLDVLNLAHGTLFMVGAYIGWTVFVRPTPSLTRSPRWRCSWRDSSCCPSGACSLSASTCPTGRRACCPGWPWGAVRWCFSHPCPATLFLRGTPASTTRARQSTPSRLTRAPWSSPGGTLLTARPG